VARGQPSGLPRRRRPASARRFAMLNEGRRRQRPRYRRRGWVSSRRTIEPARPSRSATSRSSPEKRVTYRGSEFEEMDIDAVIRAAGRKFRARRRARALECAGMAGNEKRWQDVEELLAARPSTSSSTVNIQHLESLNDVVERITGRAATRDACRTTSSGPRRPGRARRQHTGSAPAGAWRTATSTNRKRSTPRSPTTTFRPGNLGGPPRASRCSGWPTRSTTACSVTWRTTASPAAWETRGAESSWPSRGAPGGEHLVRRAVAYRPPGPKGDLLGVAHSGRGRGTRRAPTRDRSSGTGPLLEDLGGTYHEIVGADSVDGARRFRPGRARHAGSSWFEPAVAVESPAAGAR